MKKKSIIAITMGDPGGIGPEIILKSFKLFPLDGSFYLVLIGSRPVFEFVSKHLKLSFKPYFISVIDRAWMREDAVNFLDVSSKIQKTKRVFEIGKISSLNGVLAFRSLERAAKDASKGLIDAIVTAPLHKATMCLAVPNFTGHTEYLAKTSGRKEFAMFFYSEQFCVTLATIHLALKDVPRALKTSEILSKIKLTDQFLKSKLKINKPKIAVACLNPHGKEFGTEEGKVITPAVEQAKKLGILVAGPLPGDQVFHDAYEKRFHAVIAMYHDQGLAPFKMVAFNEGVNVTLGLPYIRTSPDHGTAFDIAYQNKANPTSFLEALCLARRII